jgi:hypothetical protein
MYASTKYRNEQRDRRNPCSTSVNERNAVTLKFIRDSMAAIDDTSSTMTVTKWR